MKNKAIEAIRRIVSDGQGNIDESKLKSLSRYLGCSRGEIIDWLSYNAPIHPAYLKLILLWRCLSHIMRERVSSLNL